MMNELRRAYACNLDFFRAEAEENGDTPLLITSLRNEMKDVESVAKKISLLVSTIKV